MTGPMWAKFITPALFVVGLVINVVALVRFAGGPDQPLDGFATGFVGLNLAWLLLEVPVTFRLPATPPREVATLLTYGLARAATIGAALLGPLPWHRLGPVAAIPVVVFACGVALRLVAMRTLGRFYSHHVIRRDDHVIVHTGPYRVIRHPAYAGMVLGHLGLVLFFLNPAAVVLFLALVAAIGWRIRVEERELVALPAYRTYALGRPRLLPGVW
jgi:protein-S-isoprenylcysteine O-methyltransferase Ste14